MPGYRKKCWAGGAHDVALHYSPMIGEGGQVERFIEMRFDIGASPPNPVCGESFLTGTEEFALMRSSVEATDGDEFPNLALEPESGGGSFDGRIPKFIGPASLNVIRKRDGYERTGGL